MKKTKLNPKHLYAIFAFLLSAVVAFCGVQIRQEYSSRRKDIDTFAELAEWVEIKEPDEPKEATELRNGEDADGESNAPALTVRHNIPLLVSRNSDCIQNQLDDEKKGKAGAIDRKLKRKIDEKKQAHGLKQG